MMKNPILALVTAIAIGLLPSPAIAALEAHWKLQDNAASTTIVATVGTSAALSGAGNTSASSVAGPGNLLPLALSFDGANDRILTTTGNAAASQNRAFITLSCWFYVAATTDTTTFHDFVFCGNGESGAVRAYIGMDTDGKVRAAGRAGIGESAYSKLTTASFDDGAWHHAAAVFDYAGDAITIYVDGVAVSQSGTISFTATASGNSASLDMEIAGPGYFKGRLADCRIYSSDETANIATIMADGVDVVAPSITTSATQSLEESERDVVTVAATDGATPYVWSITGGADQALFAINSSTGALTMPGSADYENPEDADTNNVYVVEVTCTDDDSETDALTINVTVTDEGGGGVVDPLGGGPIP